MDCLIISSQIKDDEDQTDGQELKETMNDILQFTMHNAVVQNQQMQMMNELKEKLNKME